MSRTFWDAVFSDETDKPLKCPDCQGSMIVTEWSMDEKRVWFKCINGHIWTKEKKQ